MKQWIIDILTALSKTYTDEEIAKVNFNIGQAYLAAKAYTDSEILAAKVIPSGTVIMWTGIYDDIPDGWVPCDGNNGTPDLLGLFVRAAGDGHPVNETGGTLTHIHASESEHFHELEYGTGVAAGKDLSDTTTDPLDIGNIGSAGTIPPYHCLWYIMKL